MPTAAERQEAFRAFRRLRRMAEEPSMYAGRDVSGSEWERVERENAARAERIRAQVIERPPLKQATRGDADAPGD